MARVYQPKTKELANIDLKRAEDVWIKNEKGKPVIRQELELVGKIDVNFPHVILKPNRPNCKTAFIEDFSALTKRTKGQVVDFFMNDKGAKGRQRRVVYLVAKKKPKAAKGVKKNGKKQ